MTVHALWTPRHDCSACGACCNNVRVRFVDDEERQRIAAFAEEFGLVDAVDPSRIVSAEGVCPFLDEGWKCRIHAAHGLMAKPLMCRVFPLVVVRTESGDRIGVDPASRAFRTTWRTGTNLEPDRVSAPTVSLPPEQVRAERGILTLAGREGATLAKVAGALCGLPSWTGPDLPPGLGGRMLALLRRSPLRAMIEARRTGAHNRAALGPLLDWFERTSDAPEWSTTPEDDAYSLACLQAMLYLRLATPVFPSTHAAALFALLGLVTARWACTDDADRGACTASWMRLMRVGWFWQQIVPDPPTMLWLATGRESA